MSTGIPKIIHYSWLSHESFPIKIKKNIDDWKKRLPDYEFICWDSVKLYEIGNPRFAYEAYLNKKWAFAADYIRMYAIYHFGGIWMDVDVQLFKPFDPFLEHQVFIGKESWIRQDKIQYLTAHTFGAVPGHSFIKACLDHYKDRPFVLADNPELSIWKRFDLTISPEIMYRAALKLGYHGGADEREVVKNGITVYPSYFFCHPKDNPVRKSFCVHHCTASWSKEDL